jgi:hypothetical protein
MSVEHVTDAACVKALGLKARVARRRLELYKRVERIEGELTSHQFADLLRVSERATLRQKSVEWVLQRRAELMLDVDTEPVQPPSSDSTAPNDAPSAVKGEDVLGAELRALRNEGQRLRQDWEQLELHQKGEDVARATWENRLRHAEEETNALWEIVETILEKVKLNASGQAKLERRIGYSQRRNERFQKTGRPPHAAKALKTTVQRPSDSLEPSALEATIRAEADGSSEGLEIIEIQMSGPPMLEDDGPSSVGNETELSQRSSP